MATTSTTLGAACGRNDLTITVAATTDFVVGRMIQIDAEFMTQIGLPVGLQVPVKRGGQLGSSQIAHDSGATVTVGLLSDFSSPSQTEVTTYLAKTNIILDRATPAALGITAVGDGTGDVTASGTLTSSALIVGGGTKVVAATTTGTGVITALAANTGGSGGFAVNGVAGAASGYKLARSATPAAVTGTLDIDTGLATVVSVIVSASSDLDGDALAGVSGVITGAAGHFTAKCWKVTTGGVAGNPTLIAATAAKNVNWIAIGT